MKTQTLTKTARRILLAAAVATTATAVWASTVWTGEGADEYYGTSGNTPGGPAGRGFFFVDGITDLNGVVRNARNWTARFNSYKYIAGTSIYIGRASQTDSDKIWTIIPDNDECGFYLQSGYDLCVGWDANYGDGYLSMPNGKFAFRNLYIGPNVDNPTTKGVLSIGSAGHASTVTATGYIQIRNGDLTTIDTAITCGDLEAANKGNTTVTIDKTGGDWCVNGVLKMAAGSGSKAIFYNRGGNIVVTTNLIVQYNGSGEFFMEGGHVTVSNMVRFAEYYLEKPNVANLYLNGGVFEAKMFRFHNSDWSTGNVVLNGGTYRAMADGSIASTEGRRGALACLYFVVGANGGTIDTAGHDVVIPLKMQSYNGATGGLMVKGGGSLTLESNNIDYTGYTGIEPGTTLIVSNATAKSNILSHGLVVAGVPTAGQTIFTYAEALTADDLANVSCPLAPDTVFAIGGEDNKSIVVQSVAGTMSGNHWTGAAGDNNLSTPGNWSDHVPGSDENADIYCTDVASLVKGSGFSPKSITFLPNCAHVTIDGDAFTGVTAITNLSMTSHTINAPVYFTGNIQVKQNAMAEVGDITKAHITFAGGAYAAAGRSIESGNSAAVYSRCIFGKYYLASTSSSRWTALYQSSSKRVCVADDSYLYVPYAGNVSELYAGKGAKVDIGDMNTDSRPSFQVYGEMVVTNMTITGTGNKFMTYQQGTSTPAVYKFNSVTNSMSNNWFFFADGRSASKHTFYIGAGGLNFSHNNAVYCIGYTYSNNSETIRPWYSDFTIADRGNEGQALVLQNNVEFCTDDESGTARTITIDAITRAQTESPAPAITVSGSGTLKVTKAPANLVEPTVTVADSATLEYGAGASLGTGAITLGAGTTLALTATSNIFSPIANTLNLPTTGTATIRIDGARLRSGDQEIATVVNEATTANVAIDPASTALAGRKSSLRVEGGKLMLNITSPGMIMIVR